jgi:hypothetical protein
MRCRLYCAIAHVVAVLHDIDVQVSGPHGGIGVLPRPILTQHRLDSVRTSICRGQQGGRTAVSTDSLVPLGREGSSNDPACCKGAQLKQ